MLKHLIRKEVIQFMRNPFLPRLILIFPVMIMCVMPWVMDMEVRNIKVVVVDNDRSTLSDRLVRRIQASNYFIFKGLRDDNDAAINDIETSRADVVVTVPQHYERDVTLAMSASEAHRLPQILISANAVDGTKGSMGASYLASIVTQNVQEAAGESGVTVSPEATLTVSTHYLYNKHLDYKVFMIPALMSILMMMLCGFLPALNIVSEKETGTIEQINVTPVSKWAFILAKLIPYWAIGMFVLTVCFILAWAVYGITPQGNIALLYFISALLALTFSGFGLIISNYSDTMQQAIMVMWFFVVCMMLLSGLFTPVNSMPDWAQRLTLVNPIRHYIDAMRTVFVRGGTIGSVQTQVIVLAVFALAMNTWAIASYRKNS